MTDGDGLTYRVLLRSGGFSEAVCAKQVCILKTPSREKGEQASTDLFVWWWCFHSYKEVANVYCVCFSLPHVGPRSF